MQPLKLPAVTPVRLHLRAVTWLALVAVLALALMPAVSHALAFARGDVTAWAEVCTTQGLQRVALDAQDGAPATTGQHLDHCPFCKLGSDDAGAPPPAASDLAGPMPPGPLVPMWLRQAPRTQFAWSAAQPRAPPTFS
jgi:hypothetical protein